MHPLTQQLVKLLVAYNRCCIQTRIKIKTARKQNAVVNHIFVAFEQIWFYIAMFFVYVTRNKTESSAPVWICACKYLPDGNGLSAMTVDMYLHFSKNELNEVALPEVLHNKYSEAKIELLEPAEQTENIIIGKLSPAKTIIQFAKYMNVDAVAKNNAQLSSARFLGVEYVCGDLPSIQIDIPKSHYIAGNEILSKAYILRYLEHLPIYSNWIYNESNYILRLIDCDSNIFVMKSSQYIFLEKDKYTVICKSDCTAHNRINRLYPESKILSLAANPNPKIEGEDTKENDKKE